MPIDEKTKNFILDLHNEARAKVANGKLNKYGGCDRMVEVKWDENLEFVAGFNARQCKFDHDWCRNTCM